VIRTRIPEGTRLSASWHHVALVYDDQVTCCLAAPEVMPLMRDEASRVFAALAPTRALMSYSEIRAGGWDDACSRTGLAPGVQLARHVRSARQLLGDVRPYVWNDAFDPFQNATDGRYLVRGSWAGSWEGLESDVTVINWNFDHPQASLSFFAQRGHRQILAAYYDGDPAAVGDRVQRARGVRGVEGVLYATWRRRFDDLERFAEAARRAWR
jgi:hypothetical protein